MLDFFLELEGLWLLKMLLLINYAINYIFSFKQYCTVEIYIFKKKKKFLLVHIKLSFSIEFSLRIDVSMCIKVN